MIRTERSTTAPRSCVLSIMGELQAFWRVNNTRHDGPPPEIQIYANEEDVRDVFCLVRGPKETLLSGGEYVVQFALPDEYPLKPPDVYILTPNGCYDPGEKLCFSFTAYYNKMHHEVGADSWGPAWTFETMSRALMSFMVAEAKEGEFLGIHRIFYRGKDGNKDKDEEAKCVKRLARESRAWNDRHLSFMDCFNIIPEEFDTEAANARSETAREIATRLAAAAAANGGNGATEDDGFQYEDDDDNDYGIDGEDNGEGAATVA